MQKSGQIELMQQTHEMSSSSYLLMFTPTERQKVFLISKGQHSCNIYVTAPGLEGMTMILSQLQLQATSHRSAGHSQA